MSPGTAALLSRLFADSRDGLALAGPDGRVRHANAAFRAAAGLGSDAEPSRLDLSTCAGWPPGGADPAPGAPLEWVPGDGAADARVLRLEATALDLDGDRVVLLRLPQADTAAPARTERERLFELAPDPIALLDARGHVLEANPAWTVTLGWDLREIVGLPLASLAHEDDRERLEAALREAPGSIDVLRARLRSRFGGWRWLEWTLRAFEGQRLYATARDVTAQVRARDALLRHRDELEARIAERTAELDGALARLRLHADNSPLATVEWDAQLRVSYWSRRAREMTGWDAEEVLGRTPGTAPFFDGATAAAFEAAMACLLRREAPRQSHVHRLRARDGRELTCEWFDSAVHDAQGEVASILCLVQDITARAAAEQALQAAREALEDKVVERTRELERLMAVLEQQARQDPLTGLPNRRGLMDRLPRAIERSGRQQGAVVLMFVDLDRFKQVNDRLGHEAGDALLRECASRLLGAVRKTDIVARLGGDEFVVVLENVREPGVQARRVAEKIRDALAAPLLLSSLPVSLSASIGVVVHAGGEASPEALIARADDGMYAAKREGGNAVRLPQGAIEGALAVD